ncbi:MAG: hypothetical protein M1834_008969 [Cirrosporium novae-zelandiae]|nr:MAG: hypothetical protein M1834_008969 [Cirrosporium novae-zelandiae]
MPPSLTLEARPGTATTIKIDIVGVDASITEKIRLQISLDTTLIKEDGESLANSVTLTAFEVPLELKLNTPAATDKGSEKTNKAQVPTSQLKPLVNTELSSEEGDELSDSAISFSWNTPSKVSGESAFEVVDYWEKCLGKDNSYKEALQELDAHVDDSDETIEGLFWNIQKDDGSHSDPVRHLRIIADHRDSNYLKSAISTYEQKTQSELSDSSGTLAVHIESDHRLIHAVCPYELALEVCPYEEVGGCPWALKLCEKSKNLKQCSTPNCQDIHIYPSCFSIDRLAAVSCAEPNLDSWNLSDHLFSCNRGHDNPQHRSDSWENRPKPNPAFDPKLINAVCPYELANKDCPYENRGGCPWSLKICSSIKKSTECTDPDCSKIHVSLTCPRILRPWDSNINCDCEKDHDYKVERIRSWNNRPSPPELDPRVIFAICPYELAGAECPFEKRGGCPWIVKMCKEFLGYGCDGIDCPDTHIHPTCSMLLGVPDCSACHRLCEPDSLNHKEERKASWKSRLCFLDTDTRGEKGHIFKRTEHDDDVPEFQPIRWNDDIKSEAAW